MPQLWSWIWTHSTHQLELGCIVYFAMVNGSHLGVQVTIGLIDFGLQDGCHYQAKVNNATPHLRLNIAYCVRPLTLFDFNTKRALTHVQWPTQFSNACEIYGSREVQKLMYKHLLH